MYPSLVNIDSYLIAIGPQLIFGRMWGGNFMETRTTPNNKSLSVKHYQHTTTLHPLTAFFQDNLGKPAKDCQKAKPFWILLSKRWCGGSGISWTTCKSFAPHYRQIPRQYRMTQFFTGRMPFLPPNQQRESTEGKKHYQKIMYIIIGLESISRAYVMKCRSSSIPNKPLDWRRHQCVENLMMQTNATENQVGMAANTIWSGQSSLGHAFTVKCWKCSAYFWLIQPTTFVISRTHDELLHACAQLQHGHSYQLWWCTVIWPCLGISLETGDNNWMLTMSMPLCLCLPCICIQACRSCAGDTSDIILQEEISISVCIQTGQIKFNFTSVSVLNYTVILTSTSFHKYLNLIIVALCNRADHYILILWLLLSSSFFPRLISAVGDWMSTI